MLTRLLSLCGWEKQEPRKQPKNEGISILKICVDVMAIYQKMELNWIGIQMKNKNLSIQEKSLMKKKGILSRMLKMIKVVGVEVTPSNTTIEVLKYGTAISLVHYKYCIWYIHCMKSYSINME